MTLPSAEAQVAFLTNLQRLLGEGNFVATYKLAVLRALADLSVEHGDDTNAELELHVRMIAEKVIGYYWRQAVPYPAVAGKTFVLKQSTGDQAAIVQLVRAAQRDTSPSLAIVSANTARWTALVRSVSVVIREMPLWKLQRVGKQVFDFLYPNVGGSTVMLRPGVAFCFRRFHGLIEDLVRGAWVRFVRALKANRVRLGDVADLDEFLFGSDREALAAFHPILNDLQGGVCFYCENRLRGASAVDHFIPWSRYPVDLGHNFVLAHTSCNLAKSDRLGAPEHLARWWNRNERHGKTLDEEFAKKALPADQTSSLKIVRWAYEQVAATKGLVWVKGDLMVPLDRGWRAALGSAA